MSRSCRHLLSRPVLSLSLHPFPSVTAPTRPRLTAPRRPWTTTTATPTWPARRAAGAVAEAVELQAGGVCPRLPQQRRLLPPPLPRPRPAPELIDLLGMHEEPMPVVAAPAAAWQQQAPPAAAPPPAAWAAFDSAPPAPTAPAAAVPPATIADHDWDIFQAAEPAMAAAFVAAAAPPPPPLPAPPPPAPAASRPDHTAAIMRMFDAAPGSGSASASSPGSSGRRAGPLLPDLSNGGRGTPVLAPFGGAPFLKSPAPHQQQQQAPSSASPTGRGF